MDSDPRYRCMAGHSYLLSEAVDQEVMGRMTTVCPYCATQGRITDRTAGQNEGSAAHEFEKRVIQDI